MKTIAFEVLVALSSCATLLMLCCAVVNCIDLWSMDFENLRDTVEKPATLFRSEWFFYSNAALCFSCVFVLFWLE